MLDRDRAAPHGWKVSRMVDRWVGQRAGQEGAVVDRKVEEVGEEEVEVMGEKALMGEEVLGTVEVLEGEVEEEGGEEDQGAEGAASHHPDHQQHPWTPPLAPPLPRLPDSGHLPAAPLSLYPGWPAPVACREFRGDRID